MSRSVAIEIEGLWKLFRLGGSGHAPHAPDVISPVGDDTPEDVQVREGHAFWALRDINVTVERGETVGIIGRNGAGKSTLLKILSRVTAPTRGRARIYGRLASLLEVGTGFHQELTGRENITLNAIMLGMTRADIARRFDEIVEFSDIGDFLDVPVKHLSSGMRIRLGFSVAVHVEPEVLIVDEVLAVGDAEFAEKCRRRVAEIVATASRTVVVVSHSMGELVNMCSRVVCLEKGRVIADGPSEDTIHRYMSNVKRTSPTDVLEVSSYRASVDTAALTVRPDTEPQENNRAMVDANNVWHLDERTNRSGDGRIRFKSLEFLDGNGKSVQSIGVGEPLTFRLAYRAVKEITGECLGAVNIAICSEDGSRIFGMPSKILGNEIAFAVIGYLFCQLDELPLLPGTYTIDISSTFDRVVTDKLRMAAVLNVKESGFYKGGRFPNPTNGRFLVRYQWSNDYLDQKPALRASEQGA